MFITRTLNDGPVLGPAGGGPVLPAVGLILPSQVANFRFRTPAPSFSVPASIPPALQPLVNAVAAPGKPWYMTWWGVGLILGGGYLGYRRFKKS